MNKPRYLLRSFHHRYLWSTGFVMALPRTGRLTEAAGFGYFLAIMAFDWFQFTVMATTPAPSLPAWSVASAWLTFVQTVLGLPYLYIQNGGGVGRQFFLRYFSLSVTVGWKFMAATVAMLWFVPFVAADLGDDAVGWCTTVALGAINVMMFWRIGFNLDSLARDAEKPISSALINRGNA